MLELVCDNFAGGGGASLGMERALGHVDVAINHDPRALAIHKANHPNTRHFEQSITSVDPLEATDGRPVGLAWFSPDCKHFSKAKGGKPVQKNIRDLAWVVVHWAKRVRPRVIMLENVEEFTTWGPLDPETQRPCKVQSGFTFHQWVKALRKLGYAVEWRELRACDYGTPTTRKRFFLIARCDGRPIIWPKPTHGEGLLPYRTAAECLDWSLPTKSIFNRKRPLAEATMRRIARGVFRYVLEAERPFIVPLTHHGKRKNHDINAPFKTITAANRGELAVVQPHLVGYHRRDDSVYPIDDPLRTQDTSNRYALVAPHIMVNTTGHSGCDSSDPVPTITTGNHHYLMAPWFVARYGERPGQEPRTRSVQRPHPTVVPTQNGAQLCAAFLAQHNRGATGHETLKPMSTITAKGSQQQLVTSHLLIHRNNADGESVEAPLRTITAGGNHFHEVRSFLIKYYGNGAGSDLREPLDTVTTRDRFGLVNVRGIDYQIVDIQMRMLSPRELFRAQGFPDSYIIDPEYNGKPLTKTAQVKACGNSVCPQLAEALVRANVQLRHVVPVDEPLAGGLFG